MPDGYDGADSSEACPPQPHPNRCDGNDSTFVFLPPLACEFPDDAGAIADAGTPDVASAADANADASDGDTGPCALITPKDVFFTAEACRAFVAKEASGDVVDMGNPMAPVIDAPVDGQVLTADDWSLFYWHQPAQDSRRDLLQRALDLFEPSAFAFPLSGVAYVLEFTQGCTEILRVMVLDPFWVPDPASWTTLTSLTGPVKVSVVALQFDHDTIISKPLRSPPVTITMGH